MKATHRYTIDRLPCTNISIKFTVDMDTIEKAIADLLYLDNKVSKVTVKKEIARQLKDRGTDYYAWWGDKEDETGPPGCLPAAKQQAAILFPDFL